MSTSTLLSLRPISVNLSWSGGGLSSGAVVVLVSSGTRRASRRDESSIDRKGGKRRQGRRRRGKLRRSNQTGRKEKEKEGSSWRSAEGQKMVPLSEVFLADYVSAPGPTGTGGGHWLSLSMDVNIAYQLCYINISLILTAHWR